MSILATTKQVTTVYLICMISSCLVTPGQTVAQSVSDQAVAEDLQKRNLASFDYVWQTVRDLYWDPDLGGIDWDEVKTEFRPKMEAANSMEEAREILRTMLKRLQVSHFGIIPSDAYEQLDSEKPQGAYTTGMDIRIVDDQVLVTEVRADSPASELGVKTGWEIVRIGEIDVRKRFQEISSDLGDHPHRRSILVDAAKGKLSGRSGESIVVWFSNENNEEVPLKIAVAEPRGKRVQFGHIPEFHLWIETRKFDGNIGYIRFNAFMDPAYLMPVYNKAMEDFKEAEGIIIDVRGNGGGLGEMATSMLGWLLKDGREQMGTVILRDTELKMFVHPRAEPYTGKVVVLIDEMSISAAEFFASGIHDLGLGQLIGTRTAGAVLGSSIEKLPNGDGFQFARANYISKSTGKTLEGIGVLPQQEVEHRRDALLQGRDLQLEAAIRWIETNE